MNEVREREREVREDASSRKRQSSLELGKGCRFKKARSPI